MMATIYTGAEYSEDELYEDLLNQAINEHILTYEAFEEMVDEFVYDRLGYGFFHPDEDLEELKSKLKMRWPDVREQVEHERERIIPM